MRALAVACLLAACADSAKPQAPPVTKPELDRHAADLAHGMTTELDTASVAFGEGVIAELLGDTAAARAA
ncbi:MAG TPA: hypothetical protein VK427_08380, partial [Kofleriaceae bacterium]|nr:hypothetical protein [Kofleriaceae bacterium]